MLQSLWQLKSGFIVTSKSRGFWSVQNGPLDPEIPNLRLEDLPAGGGVSGSVAVSEGDDTIAASGLETITGTSAATEGNDTSAISALLSITGPIIVSEGQDTIAASGLSVLSFSGTIGATEGNDTISADGVGDGGIGGSYNDYIINFRRRRR